MQKKKRKYWQSLLIFYSFILLVSLERKKTKHDCILLPITVSYELFQNLCWKKHQIGSDHSYNIKNGHWHELSPSLCPLPLSLCPLERCKQSRLSHKNSSWERWLNEESFKWAQITTNCGHLRKMCLVNLICIIRTGIDFSLFFFRMSVLTDSNTFVFPLDLKQVGVWRFILTGRFIL